MERKIGLSSWRAFSNASGAPRIPIHRVVGVLQQIRALFVDQAVGVHGLGFSFCRRLRGDSATGGPSKG